MSYASFFVHFTVSTEVVRRHQRALLKAIAKRDADTAATIADTYMRRGSEHLLGLLASGGKLAPP